jgi:uncharacterized membrane protein
LYFLIFRISLNQFVVDDFLDARKSYFVILVGFVISIYLLIGYIYKVYFQQKSYLIIFALISIFIAILLSLNSNILFQTVSNIFFAVSVSLYSYPLITNYAQKIEKNKWILPSIIIIFIALYSLLSVMRNLSYHSSAYDLGIYTQAFYKYSHFFTPQNTIRGLNNLWGDHFNPILIPLSVIFYRLYPSSNLLLILQAVIVVCGIIPLYFLCKDLLKNRTAAYFLALAYLLFFGLQSAIMFDFHTITLMPTFFLLTFYFANKNKWGWYFVGLLFLLACKEDVSLFIIFLGLFIIYWKKTIKIGLITSLIGLIWFIVSIGYIIPHYSESGFAYFTYHILGATPKEVVVSVITNPLHAIYSLGNTPEKQATLFMFAGSFGLLFIFAPSFLLLALPMLGENLWNDATLRWWGFHYGVSALPVMIIATVFGIQYLATYFHEKQRKNLITIISFYVFLSSLFMSLYFGTPIMNIVHRSFYKIPESVRDTNKVIATIPEQSSVTTQHSVVPHLANRDLIFQYPGQNWPEAKNPDYFFFTLINSSWPMSEVEETEMIQDFLNRKDYGLIYNINGAFLFKKGEKTSSESYDKATEFINNYRLRL